MTEPLRRHSERVIYLKIFVEAARCARSVWDLEAGRTYILCDLQQIPDKEVRSQAQEGFQRAMSTAEAVQTDRPDMVAGIVVGGMRELLDYLEANDVGDNTNCDVSS
ncbi:MAG: hypothetical protein Q8N18_00350 [Opitutaceae bacterium]|nr:hypothetical protein [Opitutaceae bacterium]